MDIAVTTMSSKGQIVLPKELRKGFKKGDKLLLMRKDNEVVMKKATALEQQMAGDVAFSKRIREAWERYDRGEFKSMPVDRFLKELEKW